METSEQIGDIAAALAKAQGATDALLKDKKANIKSDTGSSFSYGYADLATVIACIKKPLAENGIAYTQTIHQAERGGVLITRLIHSSGQWIASYYPLLSSGTPQQIGSALTYARRYSLCAIVGVAAEEDDDGDGASDTKTDMRGDSRAPANGRTSSPPPRPTREQFQNGGQPEPRKDGKTIKQAKEELRACTTTEQISLWKQANEDWLNRLAEASAEKHDEVQAWMDNCWGNVSQEPM